MAQDKSYTFLPDQKRIVITGIGLTAPNGNHLGEFRNHPKFLKINQIARHRNKSPQCALNLPK